VLGQQDGDPSTWPLIPRGDDDDVIQHWLDFCKGSHTATESEIKIRFYHNEDAEYPFTSQGDKTFTQILTYEAAWFAVRCRQGNKMKGVRTNYQDCEGDACFEETSESFGLLPTQFSSDFTNPSESNGATKYNSWPTKAQGDLINVQVDVAGDFFSVTRPSPTTSKMGTVLYLTYLSKTYATDPFLTRITYENGDNLGWRNRLFDCSPEPVPGEYDLCHVSPPDYAASNPTQSQATRTDQSTQKMTSWPHFGCFADVYRVDRLRTDVPMCDYNVDGDQATFFLSHASFFQFGTVVQGTNPSGLGCSAAQNIDATTHADTRGNWITQADKSTTTTVDDAAVTTAAASQLETYTGLGCGELGRWNKQEYNSGDDQTLYGTCCAQTTTFWEPIGPAGGNAAQTSYDCKNQYMFTLAERELAFGLKGSNDGFHWSTDADDTHNTAKGYWKAAKHNGIADGQSNSVAALAGSKTEDGSEVAICLSSGAESPCSTVAHKAPWSLSSDIQGAYKVVSTTTSLGTECKYRHGKETETENTKYTNNYDVTALGQNNPGTYRYGPADGS